MSDEVEHAFIRSASRFLEFSSSLDKTAEPANALLILGKREVPPAVHGLSSIARESANFTILSILRTRI